MRWPWRRQREPIRVDASPAREAVEALRAAEASLAEAVARQPKVDRAVRAHQKLQWENHLGPRVHRALTGEK